MEDTIKAAINQAIRDLEQAQARFDQLIDGVPAQSLWFRERVVAAFQAIREGLETAASHSSNASSPDARVHVSLLEMQERVTAASKLVDEQLSEWHEHSQGVIDEATLQATLAAMEAKDFWERRGDDLMEEFKRSQDAMQTLANEAASELQGQIKRWGELFGDWTAPEAKPSKDADK